MKPLRYRITHQFAEIQISEKNLAKLLEVVSWQQVPFFPDRERTAWHVFEDNQLSAKPQFRAAKLKGVGVWNPQEVRLYTAIRADSFLDQPQPPQAQEYKTIATYRHVGFTKEGEYTEVYSQATPFGGITHSRAFQEYHNAQKLWEKNVPAIAPFMVMQYPDYEFQGEPLGAVISLFPEIYPYRLDMLFHPNRCLEPEERNFCAMVRESLGLSGSFNDETERLKSITILGRKVGKLIHDFSKAGLYRHSGGWGNIQYCVEQGQPFLTDLDSTRNVDELPKLVQPLQILRDLASSLHWFLARFYRPMLLDEYTLTNLLKYDPLSEIIGGYFVDASQAYIQQIAKKL